MEIKQKIEDEELLKNYKKHVSTFLDSDEFSELIFKIIYKKLSWYKKLFFYSKSINNIVLQLEKMRKNILKIFKNSFYISNERQKKLSIEIEIVQSKEIFDNYNSIKLKYPELSEIIENKIIDIYIDKNNLETRSIFLRFTEGNDLQDKFKCFIARPYNIDEAYDWNKVVFNILKQKNIEALDAEKITGNINILTKIENLIDEANFAIVDLTKYEENNSNLNAIFEMGIVRGKKKEILFTIKEKEFKENKLSDIKAIEGIIYKNSKDLEEKLICQIENVIKKIK